MCNSLFRLVSYYNLYRVILKALCLVDRNGISNLERDDSRIIIIIVFVGAPISIYTERNDGFSCLGLPDEFKIITPCVDFINRFLKFNIKPDLLFLWANIDNSAF